MGAGLAVATTSSVVQADTSVLTVWVSPSGSDAGDGTASAPFATLGAANRFLCAQTPDCSGLGRPVEIRIKPGVYRKASVSWRYHDDTYPTRFVPAGWRPGWSSQDVLDHGGYPVFDGGFTKFWGFSTKTPTGNTHFEWRYLKWQHYLYGAIIASGGGDNTIAGNVFREIGSYYSKRSDYMAYSGLSLVNSHDNDVRANHFVDILNSLQNGYGHEHAVYLQTTSFSWVVGNRFVNVGGDPVRVRDGANYNIVEKNTFTRAGQKGYIGDWQCLNSAARSSCPDGNEVKSWRNVFRYNTLNSPHPWHASTFKARFCYDLNTWCPSSRISP